MILFIDDQALLTKPLRDILVDIGGYNVLYAMSYSEAIEKVEQHQQSIKIILLDIMMPVENGHPSEDKFGLSTGLRLGKWLHKQLPNAPIIALTVRDDISDEEMSQSGIREICVKPVNPQELLSTIETYLKETK